MRLGSRKITGSSFSIAEMSSPFASYGFEGSTVRTAMFGGTRTTSTVADVTRLFLALLGDAALLVYHWRALRQDGRIAQNALDNLHAAFPTVIIYNEKDPF